MLFLSIALGFPKAFAALPILSNLFSGLILSIPIALFLYKVPDALKSRLMDLDFESLQITNLTLDIHWNLHLINRVFGEALNSNLGQLIHLVLSFGSDSLNLKDTNSLLWFIGILIVIPVLVFLGLVGKNSGH